VATLPYLKNVLRSLREGPLTPRRFWNYELAQQVPPTGEHRKKVKKMIEGEQARFRTKGGLAAERQISSISYEEKRVSTGGKKGRSLRKSTNKRGFASRDGTTGRRKRFRHFIEEVRRLR